MSSTTAAEIMIPLDEYPHIPYWFTLRQAVAEMETSELERDGRKSLPRVVLVFDERYQLLGIVRRRDILRGLQPDFFKSPGTGGHGRRLFDVKVDASITDLSVDKMLEGIRERAERPVSEVMVPIQNTVQGSDNLLVVINEMIANHLSLVPVITDQKVVGVVRTVDVFHEVAKSVL